MEVIDFVFEFQAQKAIKKGIVKEAEVRVSMVILIERKILQFSEKWLGNYILSKSSCVKRCKENNGNSRFMTGAPSSKVRKTLRVSAQYSRIFAFCCSLNVRVSSLGRRAGTKTASLQHGGTWR